jgi:hypothetical protein
MKKSELLKKLAEGTTTVTFTKKDGSDRVMVCTRAPSLIPAEFQPKTSETDETVEASDNIRVFDVEKQGWRSFNFASIKA